MNAESKSEHALVRERLRNLRHGFLPASEQQATLLFAAAMVARTSNAMQIIAGVIESCPSDDEISRFCPRVMRLKNMLSDMIEHYISFVESYTQSLVDVNRVLRSPPPDVPPSPPFFPPHDDDVFTNNGHGDEMMQFLQ